MEEEIRRPLEERLKDYYEGDANRKHLHKLREMSFGDYEITGKQLGAIKKVLAEDRTKRMNRVEKQWAKRKQRRLLGLQHRSLQGGWKFLQPIKKMLPRRVKIDNYKPDFVFYFCNVMIFLSCGFNYGVSTAVKSLELVLVRIGAIVDKPTSQRRNEFPLLVHSELHSYLDVLIMVTVLVGINVFYGAIKEGLWIYVLIMLGAIITEAGLGAIIYENNYCDQIESLAGEKFDNMIQNYYHSVPAVDEDGRNVLKPDGSPFMARTMNDAIMMDKIQRFAGCCGSNGYIDYLTEPNPLPDLWIPEVPQSCCTNLWKNNLHCAKEIPEDKFQLEAKINKQGCKETMKTICENAHMVQSQGSINMALLHLILFLISFICIVYQLRQIRQLERTTHFHIPGDTANRKLVRAGLGYYKDAVKFQDTTNLSEEVLQVINSVRKALGLDKLGRKMKSWVPSAPNFLEIFEPVYIPEINKEDAKKLEIEKKSTAEIKSRLDFYDNRKLKTYYKGLFSATYEQENKAAKSKIFKELKAYPAVYGKKHKKLKRPGQINHKTTDHKINQKPAKHALKLIKSDENMSTEPPKKSMVKLDSEKVNEHADLPKRSMVKLDTKINEHADLPKKSMVKLETNEQTSEIIQPQDTKKKSQQDPKIPNIK